MKHSTECKFCHRPITLEIDDTYSELGDPHGLIKIACCNQCSDAREWRRSLEFALGRQCAALSLLKSAKEGIPDKARNNLIFLTKNYARMIARWHQKEGFSWEESIVDAIIADPHHWSDVVSRMWGMFRHAIASNRSDTDHE
jgi:hypothetical protein